LNDLPPLTPATPEGVGDLLIDELGVLGGDLGSGFVSLRLRLGSFALSDEARTEPDGP
jgi:hypothetical protein